MYRPGGLHGEHGAALVWQCCAGQLRGALSDYVILKSSFDRDLGGNEKKPCVKGSMDQLLVRRSLGQRFLPSNLHMSYLTMATENTLPRGLPQAEGEGMGDEICFPLRHIHSHHPPVDQHTDPSHLETVKY